MNNSYLDYWGLESPAFFSEVTASELYLSAPLKHSLNHLVQSFQGGQQLSVITGDAGIGKSAIANWISSQLPFESFEILNISLVREESQSGWLTPKIAAFMGSQSNENWHKSLQDISKKFDELRLENRKLIIIIDAGQLLTSKESFAEIWGLLNLQSIDGTLLSFVLLGSSKLESNLKYHPELDSKTAARIQIESLTDSEKIDYIKTKLIKAKIESGFSDDSITLIANRTSGSPQRLNIICENCLIEAALQEQKKVTTEIALKCLADSREIANSTLSQAPAEEQPHKIPVPPIALTPKAKKEDRAKNPLSEIKIPSKAAVSAPIDMDLLFKKDDPLPSNQIDDEVQDS